MQDNEQAPSDAVEPSGNLEVVPVTAPSIASHWLYQRAANGQIPDPPAPLELDLSPEQMQAIKNQFIHAVRWAAQACTDGGKIDSFDPDALVLNARLAFFGPMSLLMPSGAPSVPVDLSALEHFEPTVAHKSGLYGLPGCQHTLCPCEDVCSRDGVCRHPAVDEHGS